MDLHSLDGEMVPLPILLRLNGHPSGPFNQDVSNSHSDCGARAFSPARNEPCSTRPRTLKYCTDSVSTVGKISMLRAGLIGYVLPSHTLWRPASSKTSTVLKVESSEADSGKCRCVTNASDPPASRWSGTPRTRCSTTLPVCLPPRQLPRNVRDSERASGSARREPRRWAGRSE